jgi:hypothetical protein
MMTIAQIASVGFKPKLFKKIWAIGWLLFTSGSRLLPIQKASAILIAASSGLVQEKIFKYGDIPKPSTPATAIELTIAQGTAVAALEASSLM